MRLKRSSLVRFLISLPLCVALGVGVGCKDSGGSATPSPGAGGSPAASGESPTTGSAAPQKIQDKEILIGHVASLTGETSTFGTETDEGIKLAIKEINAKGGILGKQVKLSTQDDQSKADEAKTVATGFATKPEIVAVIGEVASKRSLAMAPALQEAGIPMVSPSSTNSKVTEEGDYIFRVCFIDEFQGLVMAKFAKNTLKVNKVAIMRNQSEDYSVGLANVFKAEFEKMGGTIIGDVNYQATDADFKSQLGKIKEAEAIFVPGYYGEIGPIAQQARELGIKAPLMGCDGWDSEKLVEGAGGAGKALENCYFSNHYSKDDKSPRVQNFVKAYQAEYKKAPSGLAALGYDAMMIIADAITRAKTEDRAKVRVALAETKNFAGVTGDITIDDKRNANKSAVVLQIKGKEFTYNTTIKPGA